MKDALLVFSKAQAAIGDTGDTVESTNALSLGKAGKGHNAMAAICRVNTAYTGNGTLTVSLQQSTDGTNFTDVAVGKAFAAAALVKGAVLFNHPLPPDLGPHLRMQYRIGGTTGTALAAGKLDGFLDVYPTMDKVDNV